MMAPTRGGLLHIIYDPKDSHSRAPTLDYSANIYGNTSVAGIRDNAQNLLSSLRDFREDEEQEESRPIVFAAHSLGGIIVKQIFYGTPHAGSDQKRWLTVAKNFAPLAPGSRYIGWRRQSPLVESLTRNSSELQALCDDFRHLASGYNIMSFYEVTLFPGSKTTIVSKTSAVMGLPCETSVPLDHHHMDMVRFESEDDSGFFITCKHIERIMAENGLGPV